MSDFTVDEHEDNLKDVANLINQMGYVHRSELRELIQQWRAKQEWHREQSITKGDGGKQWQTFKECADELEALLDD